MLRFTLCRATTKSHDNETNAMYLKMLLYNAFIIALSKKCPINDSDIAAAAVVVINFFNIFYIYMIVGDTFKCQTFSAYLE